MDYIQEYTVGTVHSPHYVAFPMCIAANCGWSFVNCVIILCVSLLSHAYCSTMCVLLTYILSCQIAG